MSSVWIWPSLAREALGDCWVHISEVFPPGYHFRPEIEFLRVGDRERALGSRACLCSSPGTFGLFEKRQRFVQARSQHSIWTVGVLGGGPIPRMPRKGTPMTLMTSPTRRRKCLRVSEQPPLVKRWSGSPGFLMLCVMHLLVGSHSAHCLEPCVQESRKLRALEISFALSSTSSLHHALCQAWRERPRSRGLGGSCLTRAFLPAALAGPM